MVIDIMRNVSKTDKRGHGASLVAQMVNNLPVMKETQVQPLGFEDPVEKGMATHSRILVWRSPWTVVTVHGVTVSCS